MSDRLIAVGDLVLDIAEQRLSCGERSIPIRPQICRFLNIMMTSRGQLVPYSTMMDRLYRHTDDGPPPSRSLRSTIIKLARSAVVEVGSSFKITAIWGSGLVARESATATQIIHPFTPEQWKTLQFCVSFTEGRNPGIRERVGIPRERV